MIHSGYATGRRKNAIAKVSVTPGKGNFQVNGMSLMEYFNRRVLVVHVEQPIELTNQRDSCDIIASVQGGGKSGQAGALRHGIARALAAMDDDLKAELRKAGYLTRDSRMKERKKYGLAKARKRFQFSKR